MGKGKPDKGGGGGGGGGGLQDASLDDVASALVGKAPLPGHPDADSLVVRRWREHPDVVLLRYGSPAALKAALSRLSAFLEDKEHKGKVVEALERGKMGGALSYTGHNFRASDAARFFTLAAAGKVTLAPAENALRQALLEFRLLNPLKGGGYSAPPQKLGVLAMAQGWEREEAKETLLHEAMHGLFYVSGAYEDACYVFWKESLGDGQRDTWRTFLSTLGYDASNEELAVNEFQAYMTTERKLFTSPTGGKKGGGKGGGGKKAGGGDGAADLVELQRMQAEFGKYIEPHVPLPLPCCTGCSCVFVVK